MIRLLVFLACVWGSVAGAETIRVIAGEHSGFTRVVLIAGRDPAVTLETTPEAVVLVVAGGPHRFDLTDVFRKIGRTRVADIRAEGTDRLRIVMACPCTPVLGRGGPGLAMIDLTDAAPEAQVTPAPMAKPDPATAPLPLRFGLMQTDTTKTDTTRTGAPMSDALLSVPLDLPRVADPATDPRALPDPETARGLQFQIARAVSQGLLEPSHVPDDTLAPAAPPAPNIAAESAAAPRFFGSRPGVQVRAETPVGQGLLDQVATARLDRQAIGCLSEERVGMADWGKSDRFAADLGQLQRDIFTETGRPDAEAARRLARHYLFFGMGAEARLTLVTAGLTTDADAPLLALAEIVDHGQDTVIGAFHAQAHCETPAALWAVLANSDPTVVADAQIGAVIQAFTALPWHLKDHLGPTLVQRLRAAGNPAAAETVLRIVKRATDESSPAMKLEEAAASLQQKDEATALDLLGDVAAENGQLSPEALVRMIDVEIAAGRPITPETALLAESYALEYRKTAIADDLWRVNVLALAASGQYDKVFDLLAKPGHDGLRDPLWSATLDALTRQAADLDFARWAMNVPPDVRPLLDLDVGNAVADRLVGLGFAQVADDYLAGPADGASGRTRKILRSRAALDQNRPRRAEAELTGLSGPDIDRLRAEARLATGDYAASQALFRSIDARDAEVDAAFLARDWPRLREVGPDGIAAFGALALAPPAPVPTPDDDAPLQSGRNLLEDSAATRAVIAGMLSHFELRDAEGADPTDPDSPTP